MSTGTPTLASVLDRIVHGSVRIERRDARRPADLKAGRRWSSFSPLGEAAAGARVSDWDCKSLHAAGDAERADWNILTRTQSPLADAAWTDCFVRAFTPSGQPPQTHLLYRSRQLVVGIPLVRTVGLVRAWTSIDNVHNPYWIFGGEPDTDSAAQLLSHLLTDSDYILLRRLPLESPACLALLAGARQLGLVTSVIQSGSGDARLRLHPSWDEMRAQLPRSLLRSLPRQQRQLEKMGALELVTITTDGPALVEALTECFDVETRGWKGAYGSPIRAHPQTLQFYTELARALARTGRFALFLLRLNGKVVAFEYCLRGGGHIEMLKLSFDPSFAAQSPGQVLRLLLLQQEVAQGAVTYYHLGRPSPWKMRWASEVAPLGTVRIYGKGLRARGAFLAGLAGPVLRSRLTRVPVVARARQLLPELKDRPASHGAQPAKGAVSPDDPPAAG